MHSRRGASMFMERPTRQYTVSDQFLCSGCDHHLTAAKPFSGSAMISSICSVPMDRRMVLGLSLHFIILFWEIKMPGKANILPDGIWGKRFPQRSGTMGEAEPWAQRNTRPYGQFGNCTFVRSESFFAEVPQNSSSFWFALLIWVKTY